MLFVDQLRLVVVLVLVYGRSGSLSRSSMIGCKVLVLVIEGCLRSFEGKLLIRSFVWFCVGMVLFKDQLLLRSLVWFFVGLVLFKVQLL